MTYLFLFGAIVFEVVGTLSLRMVAWTGVRWIGVMALCYALAFTMLTFTLQSGMPIGVAYGIWTAVGVALTAIAGRVLFRESFTWLTALGLALIVGGVLLIEFGRPH
jgi:small multidrug resistance pump